jgi:hypothetical protein
MNLSNGSIGKLSGLQNHLHWRDRPHFAKRSARLCKGDDPYGDQFDGLEEQRLYTEAQDVLASYIYLEGIKTSALESTLGTEIKGVAGASLLFDLLQ